MFFFVCVFFWSSRFRVLKPFVYVFAYLLESGGEITWQVIVSWIAAKVSWVLPFPTQEWQPPPLSTMLLEWRFASLHSRQSLSSVSVVSRHVLTATVATGESERARPSSSGGSSSRRRAESSSVSKALDTRPSSSSSRHHQHHSTGDRRSLSSSSSRASPDRKSQPSHRERRRESSDRTGGTFVARQEF